MDHIWTNLNGLTQSAIVIISLIAIVFHVRWTRRNTALGPTFLTTLGIFFCFIGIAWGLLNFDASDIRYSIPRLLEGIRTSFWASVAGIFWALTIKARVAVWGDAKLSVRAAGQPGATLSDVTEHLARLSEALAGKEDSTLLGQIKLLRSDSNYRLDRLNTTFESYSAKIAEANSRALMQALQSVVRDFNSQINDQFGDNFKHLNAAVEKLVTWQSHYEQQLASLIAQETETRKSMTEAAGRFTEMVKRTSEFTEIVGSLKKLLVGLNTEKEQLNFSLSLLGELINHAAKNLPTLDQNIRALTQQIEQGVKANQEAMTAILRNTAQAVQAHNQQLTGLLSSAIAASNKELSESLSRQPSAAATAAQSVRR
jgi:CII-binding regulator of phage lambda lysogenization HflD